MLFDAYVTLYQRRLLDRCGLEKDRTLEVLKMISTPGIGHYGIISCKEDEMDERIGQLGEDYHIRVICYPENKHEAVRIILEKLLEAIDKEKYQKLDYCLSKLDMSIADRFVYDSELFPFVGRNDELNCLRKFCENRDNLWWAITGAGGSGKSRLAYEFSKELKDKQWHICNLEHSDYDDLKKISDSCTCNTLFIADYVQGHIKEIAEWLEKLIEERRSFVIKVLLIERDSNDFDNDISWNKLLKLHMSNSRKLRNSCYQENFLELEPLSDQNLKGIMYNYVEKYSKDGIDESELIKLLGILENIDKDLKRPLYALFISDAWLENPNNPTKWNRNEVLDYMYERENDYYHNKIKDFFNNIPNVKLNKIIDKIRMIATIYDGITVIELENKYLNIYKDLNDLVSDIITVESVKDFLNIIGLIENDIIKAIKPDLIGEYFICKQIKKEENLKLLFVENWEAEISILSTLVRMEYDYGDLLNNNKDFISKILSFDTNDIKVFYLYSNLMILLTYYCTKNDNINIYFNKINILLEKNVDEEIAVELAKSLFNLTVDQKVEIREKVVKRLEDLMEDYKGNEEIAVELAKALVNLTTVQEDTEAIEKVIKRLENLTEDRKGNEEIATALAKALVNLMVGQKIEIREKAVKKLENLIEDHKGNEEIALRLAKALFNLTVGQKIEIKEKVVKKLENLTERYNDNKELRELLELVQK